MPSETFQTLKTMRPYIIMLIIGSSLPATAQVINFDPGNWMTTDIAQQRTEQLVLCNRVLTDTLFVENIQTSELEMIVEAPVLARLEFDPQNNRRMRRVDIRQTQKLDSIFVENIDNGELTLVVANVVQDIPEGSYEEYHPNGQIRIRGTLAGYNADGSLKKTGEWLEWDASGKVIRSETHP